MAGPESIDATRFISLEEEGVREICGSLQGEGLSFSLVVSRFNSKLTAALARSVIAGLRNQGVYANHIEITWVPGAFEIPCILENLANVGKHSGLIALGAILQGETSHATHISQVVTRAISEIARRYALPVIDGVVVAPTKELAEARCQPGPQNRGVYAAAAAIEMANLFRRLQEKGLE